jgi:adenosylhomocysteine nucleosidase
MLSNALVITPLKSEFQFLNESFQDLGFQSKDSVIGPIQIKTYPDINMTVAIGGHGKVQFGIQTQYLLSQFPDASIVFCVGAAGGLSKVKTFDVVIADRTVEHDYLELFDPAPPPVFSGCGKTIERIRDNSIVSNLPFATHHGLIASGDEDIISSDRAAEIFKDTGAIAVAWEGAGGARAALFNNKPFLEIRGITDVADNAAPADFRTNLKKSMKHVAMLLNAMATISE